MIKINARNARMWSSLGTSGAFHGIGLIEAKKNDNSIMVMAADTLRAFGLDRFLRSYPEDFLNLGIAEQNLIGMAAGLSSEGSNVFVSTYASFLTARAYEFIRHNLGVEGYPVKLIGCFSGAQVGTSGYSHWCIDDMALMRAVPGMVVLSPADATEAVKMALSVAKLDAPVYVRLCGSTGSPIVYSDDYEFEIGKGVTLQKGSDIALIATGLMVSSAVEVASSLEEEGISCSVYDFHTVKPIDGDLLEKIYASHKLVVTIEEHSVIGGLGAAVAEHKAAYSSAPKQLMIGFDDCYHGTGSRQYVLKLYGLTVDAMARRIFKAWEQE